jgi:transposase-like protein
MVLGERAVHDAEEPSAVPTGVLAAPHRPGAEGTHPEELAGQFEPSAQAIRNWVRQADRDDGRRQDGLTTASRMSCAGCGRESNPPGRAGDPKKTLIAGIHRESRGMYGAPRIHAELTAQGIHRAAEVLPSAIRVFTQTSPRNYPGSCSQREPKSPKGDDVTSANSRGVVCGALALALI